MLDSFADDPRFVSITLPPFSPSEHRSLVESLVGAPKVSDELAQRLRDATEGNPFFTKELIRSLVESGGIAKDDTGAWSFSKEAEISADALPATIQQAVEKRIERLPEELRDLLSVAVGPRQDLRLDATSRRSPRTRRTSTTTSTGSSAKASSRRSASRAATGSPSRAASSATSSTPRSRDASAGRSTGSTPSSSRSGTPDGSSASTPSSSTTSRRRTSPRRPSSTG